MVGTTAQDATPLDDTADPLGTIQLNLPSNQSPEIRRSIGVEVEKRHAIYVPSEPDLPALARSLQQALEDYVPADSAGLPVRKGDLIQCFGETDGLESYFGRIYPGGAVGVYPRNLVSNIDPTDPAFHDTLAEIDDLEKQGYPKYVMDANGRLVNTPLPCSLAELEDSLRRSHSYRGVKMFILCPAYVCGICREGDACRFSHDIDTAEFGVCENSILRTCRDKGCLHEPFRLPHSKNQDEQKVLPDIPEIELPP
jgi:hypothetical protein